MTVETEHWARTAAKAGDDVGAVAASESEPQRNSPSEPRPVSSPQRRPEPRSADPLVELRDTEVRLGTRVLWTGVDLELAPGDFMAVLGPNGVGKTTLLRALLGMVPVSAGEIRVLGQPVGQANPRIGYLPQRRNFDAGLRVRGVDLVRFGLDGNRWGVPLPSWMTRRRGRAAERVREVIDLVGASHFAEQPIGEISGGEQQRLLIAQALVREPGLLLLDEPLNGLDLPSQAAITALIAGIAHEQGIGVMMVAHDVNPLMGYLDQVAYVGDGRIVAGTPEEVVTTETLSRLYGTTVEVVRAADGRLAVLGQPEVHAVCHGAECRT